MANSRTDTSEEAQHITKYASRPVALYPFEEAPPDDIETG